jgi:hypothetical protein
VSKSRNAARDQELLEALDPASARMLFPERFPEPLRITLEYPALGASQTGEVAEALSRAVERADGPGGRTRATFTLVEVESLHRVFAYVEGEFGSAAVDVRVNGKNLPMARELWLPLFWSLRA